MSFSRNDKFEDLCLKSSAETYLMSMSMHFARFSVSECFFAVLMALNIRFKLCIQQGYHSTSLPHSLIQRHVMSDYSDALIGLERSAVQFMELLQELNKAVLKDSAHCARVRPGTRTAGNRRGQSP